MFVDWFQEDDISQVSLSAGSKMAPVFGSSLQNPQSKTNTFRFNTLLVQLDMTFIYIYPFFINKIIWEKNKIIS